MLAGHITLQVFAGFVIMLGSAGILGLFGATLPFIMVVLLFALELLVAFLQSALASFASRPSPPRAA
jgi:F-type H+-transporting ATPase subunit a